MKTTLEKLREELADVEAELDKVRTTVLEDGWQTQRHARKARKWDFYAERKRRLRDQIDDLEAQS